MSKIGRSVIVSMISVTGRLCLTGIASFVHSKFGKIAMEKAADLSEIDCIVTDRGLREELREEYSKFTDIIIA